uniref:Uncharacterized protein n=2 Tax=Mycena chlorophos TaxID=658473 RepID=A0ABQ0M3P6_MYCCL|nr:predicted protein [Mycena chlorophos]
MPFQTDFIIQGTAQFMSDDLLTSSIRGRPHIHSPVDDLFSLFYVAQWAAVFHPDGDGLPMVQDLRKQLAEGERMQTTRELQDINPHNTSKADGGRILPLLGPLFKIWLKSLEELRSRYKDALTSVQAMDPLVKHLFLAIAYRGVGDFVEAIEEWKELEEVDLDSDLE